jgi:hypothetical protein
MSRKATATKVQSLQPQLTPSAELRRLDIFVGKWHTEGLSYGSGQSKENPYDSPVRWLGEETYEWLPGGFFLIRHWKGQIGNAAINGMEMIGYDARCLTIMAEFFLVSGVSVMVFGHIPEQNTAPHMRLAMTVILWLSIGSGYVERIGLSWVI